MDFLPVHGSWLKLLSEVALAAAWCVVVGLIVLTFSHLPCLGLNKAGGEESCAAMGVGNHRRLVQEQRRDIMCHRRAPTTTRQRRRSRAGRKPPVRSPGLPAIVAVSSVPCPSCESGRVCRRGHGRARQANGSHSPLTGVCAAGGHSEDLLLAWHGSSRSAAGQRALSPPFGQPVLLSRTAAAALVALQMESMHPAMSPVLAAMAELWGLPATTWGPTHVPCRCSSIPVLWACELRGRHAHIGRLLVLCDRHVLLQRVQHVFVLICRRNIRVLNAAVQSKGAGYFSSKGAWLFHEKQQVNFFCQYVVLFICRHGSGKTVTCAWVDRQLRLKPLLRFGIGDCGPILLNPVKPPSYLRFKTTILEDTGRSDSCGERRLGYRSARTRTPRCFYRGHFSWAFWPRWARAPDGSVTHVFRHKFTVPFTCLCNVIWELVFPHCCNAP